MIKDAGKFQQLVLPRYFRHNKMNSFIRQLNMYGFHKSRNDHTKCVFSHPSFLRDREDLLITIKRKIKMREELPPPPSTPVKRTREVAEVKTTASKQTVATGEELKTNRNLSFGELPIPSFNIMGNPDKPFSIININVSMNVMPQSDIRFEQTAEDDDDLVSIADKIDEEEEVSEERGKEQPLCSFKFMNPSCFFESMKK